MQCAISVMDLDTIRVGSGRLVIVLARVAAHCGSLDLFRIKLGRFNREVWCEGVQPHKRPEEAYPL